MTDRLPTNLPDDLDRELDSTVQALGKAAARFDPDAAFVSRLEDRLVGSYPAAEAQPMPVFRKIAPALLFILAAAALIVVVDWMIRSLAPQPAPASRNTPLPTQVSPGESTPTAQPTPVTATGPHYQWRGIDLVVAASMPDSPAESDIYSAEVYPRATADEAMVLAQRFGVQGAVYETPGELPGTTDFVVSDGRQSLRVRSTGYIEYTADIVRAYNNLAAVRLPDADQIIDAFLKSHGYAFPVRIRWSEFRSAYLLEPLAPDGTPLSYEFSSQPMMAVYLDQDGSVLRVMTSLLKDPGAPVSRVGIISAEEALQRLLDSNLGPGVLETTYSAVTPLREWKRRFPIDQPLTIYGYVTSMRSVDSAQAPFIQLDGYPLTGETRGLDQFTGPTYLEASGRFVEQNGALWFSVESWQTPELREDGLNGALERQNGEVLLNADDGSQLILRDVPADLPLPFEHAFVVGTRLGDVFEWKSIDDRSFSGGGGGGGGGGFYKLNLSGTPVAFPSATPAPTVAPVSGQYIVQAGDTLGSIAAAHGTTIDAIAQANNITDPGKLTIDQPLIIPDSSVQRVEGLRGMLSITINRQSDGNQQVSYGFLPLNSGPYVLLEGDGLEALQSNNSRPVDVWGQLNAPSDGSIGTLQVERFEIPYPDLRVQVLRGKQRVVQLEGQSMTLFTTDEGETYVQFFGDGQTGPSLVGSEGDEVQLECVAVPGETFAGYPALRILGGMLAIDPKSGQHVTMPITMDKPIVLQMPDIGQQAPPEGATIETVELELFVSDPRYAVAQPGAQPLYLQPVWRFTGHYSNGDGFEALIQAARDEFLLPETEPVNQPG